MSHRQGDIKYTIFRRAKIVTGKYTTLQWEVLFPATNTALVKDRCFPKGLESIMPRDIHWGDVDYGGEETTNKCSRNKGETNTSIHI